MRSSRNTNWICIVIQSNRDTRCRPSWSFHSGQEPELGSVVWTRQDILVWIRLQLRFYTCSFGSDQKVQMGRVRTNAEQAVNKLLHPGDKKQCSFTACFPTRTITLWQPGLEVTNYVRPDYN